MKKPQLNELVHTAEVLKGDIKRQQLQEKGESGGELKGVLKILHICGVLWDSIFESSVGLNNCLH